MTDTKHTPAMKALLSYQQADMDGIMALTSRQAIHEVADEYNDLLEALESCQNILAALIDDPKQKGSGVNRMVAWARCVEAEKKARSTIAKARGES